METWVEFYPKWDDVRKDLLRIEGRAFGPQADPEYEVERLFEKSLVVCVLRTEGKVLGYATATNKWPDAAYLDLVAVDPEFQGQGLGWQLVEAMATEFRKRDFPFMEVDARVNNGFAGKFERKYADRIVVQYPHSSRLGELMFFRIELGPEKSSTEGTPETAPSDSGALPDGSTEVIG